MTSNNERPRRTALQRRWSSIGDASPCALARPTGLSRLCDAEVTTLVTVIGLVDRTHACDADPSMPYPAACIVPARAVKSP